MSTSSQQHCQNNWVTLSTHTYTHTNKH